MDDLEVVYEEQNNAIQYNLFAYCLNDPINMADPTGKMAEVIAVGGTIAAAGGPIGMVVGGVLIAVALVGIGYIAVDSGLIELAKTSRETGKKRATDKPSWVNKDMVDKSLSAEENARRMMNDKYGTGNWKKGPGKDWRYEFNKIKKWLTRDLGLKEIVTDDRNIIYIEESGELLIIDHSREGFGWLDGVWIDTMF